MFETERAIYKHLTRIFSDAHWVRIENGVGAGIPDVNVQFPPEPGFGPSEVWIELKSLRIRNPEPDMRVSIPFRPAQYAWLRTRHKAGGRVVLLAGFATGELLVVPGQRLKRLTTAGQLKDFGFLVPRGGTGVVPLRRLLRGDE